MRDRSESPVTRRSLISRGEEENKPLMPGPPPPALTDNAVLLGGCLDAGVYSGNGVELGTHFSGRRYARGL